MLSRKEIEPIEEKALSPSRQKKTHYASLASSIFELKPLTWECIFPELQGQIEIFSTKNRPDEQQREKDFALFIKRSQQKRFAALGEKIYLASNNDGSFFFSDSPCEFWLVAKRLERGTMQLLATLDCGGICEKSKHERSILLPVSEPTLSTPAELANYVDLKELSQGESWGVDQFKVTYHPQTAQCERIELLSGEEIEIKEGDLLLYDKGWRRATPNEDTRGRSIARINQVNIQGIEMEYWGTEEGSYHTFFLPKGKDTPFHMVAENLITDIHIRTLRQAVCNIEKQKISMKSGDWLTKINGNWKVLRTEEEKQEYYQHQKRSPLLVFDKIERKSSKKWLHAHLFNPMRTQAIEIKAPVRYTRMASATKGQEAVKNPKTTSTSR